MRYGDEEYNKLAAGTRQELEHVDFTRAVVSDEFHRRKKGDHRKRAIKRLVASGEPFYSERNITYEMVMQYISITCPYCSAKMRVTTGGSNGHTWTLDLHCNCGASANLTVPAEHALSFKKKDKIERAILQTA